MDKALMAHQSLSEPLQSSHMPPTQSSVKSSANISANTSANPHADHLINLARQVVHNLEFQHRWTDLSIHMHTSTSNPSSSPPASQTHSASSKSTDTSHAKSDTTNNDQTHRAHPPKAQTKHIPPRPLISGLPPQRLYMHPDEQISLLKSVTRQETIKTDTDSSRDIDPSTITNRDTPAQSLVQDANVANEEQSQDQLASIATLMRAVQPEREWVLATHLNERWSLSRFADVFECIDSVPPSPTPSPDTTSVDPSSPPFRDAAHSTNHTRNVTDPETNPYRTKKRVLLATVDTDSTIAYYLVHDGIVKPRQN